MDPRDFEELVCQLFERMGYEVARTPYTGDGGVDAYATREGKKSIIQCKRVKGSVGEPILRDLYGTMHATEASSAFVVTTGKVSPQAQEWIKGKAISIIELPQLQALLLEHLSEGDVVPGDFNPTPTAEPGVCPRCGSPLRTIKGPRGKFMGCTSYPQCRYTTALQRRKRWRG